MEKINLLMIIDDDELNNYITTKIVGYAQLASRVESYQSPKAALEFLLKTAGILMELPLRSYSLTYPCMT
jgi:hypothetical protein